MTKERQFVVSCRNCSAPVVTALRLEDTELEALVKHLESCWPDDPLPKHPGVSLVLRRFDVRATEKPI